MHTESRPAEFDARVIAHLPLIKKLARRYLPTSDDFDSDITAYALEHWYAYNPQFHFSTWLTFKARELAATKRAKGKLDIVYPTKTEVSTPPRQAAYTLLGQVFDIAQRTLSGRVLLRRAKGDTLDEIARDLGCSNQAVSQREHTARRQILAVCA